MKILREKRYREIATAHSNTQITNQIMKCVYRMEIEQEARKKDPRNICLATGKAR